MTEMTTELKNFLEVNAELLDTNPLEFFHIAYNGLSNSQQTALVRLLNEANIDTTDARENFIRFHIAMTLSDVERPCSLHILVARYLVGILGFDYEWLLDYIKENKSEWDDTVAIHEDRQGNWMVYPKV